MSNTQQTQTERYPKPTIAHLIGHGMNQAIANKVLDRAIKVGEPSCGWVTCSSKGLERSVVFSRQVKELHS